MNVNVVEKPFVCHGNIATAGGCLAAQYLAGWVLAKACGEQKQKEILREIFPVGQYAIYEQLLDDSLKQG